MSGVSRSGCLEVMSSGVHGCRVYGCRAMVQWFLKFLGLEGLAFELGFRISGFTPFTRRRLI